MMQLMFGAIRAANPTMPEPQANAFNLENPDVFKKEMVEAGFKHITIKRCTQFVDANDVKSFWDFMTIGSAPIVLMRNNVGEEKWRHMENCALEFLRKELHSPPYKLSSDACIGVGVA